MNRVSDYYLRILEKDCGPPLRILENDFGPPPLKILEKD